MRVASDTRELAVAPGSTAAVVVDVVNTGEVIDGVSARVIGLPDEWVNSQPALLPLFPDATGQVTLSLAVPPTLPAGRHPLTVEIVSHGARLPSQYLDVDLDVAPRPGLTMAAQPRTIRARRGGRFVIELVNDGNVALDVAMSAVDADRAVRTEFTPPAIRIDPGQRAPVLLELRGPRMITGGEIDRVVTVEATARTALTAPQALVAPEAEVEPEVQARCETTVRLRQRPLLSRGLITVLVLAGIVALWALAFLLGLTKVFSGDPMTKQAPASFFLPQQAAAAAAQGGAAAANAAAPAGALPKTGQVPPGTGAAISGTVLGGNDGRPVGRILVQAERMTRDGLKLVSSAATQADGTYSLGGLFPTDYYLRFSSPGFTTVWYPNAPSQASARTVATTAQQTVPNVNVVIAGLPASISGRIDPGDALKPVTTTVTARPLSGPNNGTPTAVTTTAADGSYTLANLPAPGSYELTFVTPGYQTSTLTDTVTGGDKRLEPTITLGAAPGAIGGVVSDGANPLGGAIVTTTLNGQPLAVTTPTTGQVGAYVLDNLQTPGTYVVSFTAPGHGSVTKIVDLTAGQRVGTENVTLTSGTGSVSGTLVDSTGKGVGGATVTVGGAIASGGASSLPQTTTLTSGAVGSFAISGLPAPGSYTLTFSLAGYEPATVPVTLSGNGAPPDVTVTLSADLGSVTGRVLEVSNTGTTITQAFVGAQVTATNGSKTWTVASSAPGGALAQGGYLISGLAPGTYSVTVTAPGLQQQTGIVTIAPGQPSHLDLTLTKVN